MHRSLAVTSALMVAACIATWARPLAGQAVAPPAGAQPVQQANPSVTGRRYSMTGHGLKMTFDTSWSDGPGYQPVRFTFTPLSPPVADRTLRIALQTHGWWNTPDLLVRQDVEIPAGSGPVEAVLSLPPHAPAGRWTIRVYEEGKELEQLRTPLDPGGGRGPQNQSGAPQQSRVLTVDDRSAQAQPTGPAQNLVCPVLELPERWIDYSSLDAICLSLDQLEELRTKRPAAFSAVLDWTRAGGNLWVTDVGADWQRRSELEKLVGLAVHSGSPGPAGLAFSDADLASAKGRGISLRPSIAHDSWYVTDAPEGDSRADAVLRPLALGLVVASTAGNSPSAHEVDSLAVVELIGSDRANWSGRHGLLPGQGNPDFWNFLIPGAGLAPVKTFCVLITLFVIGIGPMNYWILRRKGKLYLLVLTTPAIAAVVTLLLFGYAIITDGLRVRVRARSVTQIDQRNGQAVCWTRLSYSAGLTPRGGLRFPADVAVFPLEHLEGRYRHGRLAPRELDWEDDQRMTAGWLAPRTPTQYVTVRSRASQCALEVLEPSGDATAPSVRNGLGTAIQQLLVCTADGKRYWAQGVAADATAALEPIEPAAAFRRLRARFDEERPTLPPELEADPLAVPRQRRYTSGPGTPPPALSQQTSRLERTLATLAGADANGVPPLSPNSYIAVVDRSPEVVLGVESPREEKGYHVVFGSW